jgi:hypothetical protein
MATLKELFSRKELWYERAIILQSFHLLRSLQRNDWREIDTALALEISVSHVSEDLKLADAIERDESLKELTRSAALKKLRHNE